MAVQAQPFLQITDGVTSVTIADGSGGATSWPMEPDGWAPNIGGFSRSQLGGRGPYDDVLETMRLDVTGATAAAAYANLQTLERLIDQAERWSRGENVAIVLIKFAPQGSTVASTAAPLQAACMGYAPGAAQACTSGSRFLMMPVSAGSSYVIAGVQLRFMRRGAWLLAAAVTGTSASVANPGPYPITGMTTHPNISPCQVRLAGLAANTAIDTADSKPIFILAQQGSDLQIARADIGVSAPFASVADAANNPYLVTTVMRYTPAVTTEVVGFTISMANMTASARRFAFFAAVRNNSVSASYTLRVAGRIQVNSTGPVNSIEAYTRPVVIDTAHTRPRFVPLGVLSLSSALKSIQLAFTASATGAGTLDVSYVVALAVDNPYARAIQLDKVENVGAYAHTVAADLIVDPQPLAGLGPTVYRAFETTSDIDTLGYYGDAYPVASGTTFQALLMCKRTGGDNVCWTYGAVSGAKDSLTLTASRYDARLVPE